MPEIERDYLKEAFAIAEGQGWTLPERAHISALVSLLKMMNMQAGDMQRSFERFKRTYGNFAGTLTESLSRVPPGGRA